MPKNKALRITMYIAIYAVIGGILYYFGYNVYKYNECRKAGNVNCDFWNPKKSY